MPGSMSAEEDTRHLLAKAKKGGRAAFDALAGRYRERFESFIARRLGKPLRAQVGADDIFQETLLRAWNGIGKFEWKERGSFYRWLCGIAVNVVSELAEKRKRNPSVPLDLDLPDRGVSASRALQRQERYEHLMRSIEGLTPDQQKVLLMVRIEGLTVVEVSRRLNRSPNAVSHLLLRALRRLRETFGDTETLGLPDAPRRD